MELSSSTLMAVVFGMLLVVAILAFFFALFLAARRKPDRTKALRPTDDGYFEVDGKRVTCSHCGQTDFTVKEILLNTWLLSLLNVDWLDPSATVLCCCNCGHLTWFAQDE